MDEQSIQEVKTISHEIVRKEFPDEEEYFDFLFDLIIPELEELEHGKEPEFLREIRAVHPLALGFTPAVIAVVFQVLSRHTYRDIDGDDDIKNGVLAEDIQRIIAETVEDKDDQEKFSEIPNTMVKNIKKARIKAKEHQEE